MPNVRWMVTWPFRWILEVVVIDAFQAVFQNFSNVADPYFI